MSILGVFVILAIFVAGFWLVNRYVTPGTLKIVLFAVLAVFFLLWLADLINLANIASTRVGS